MQELDEFLDRAEQLPPAPQTMFQLLQLLNDPDVDTSKVVELISYDPALTADILQACNTAYFAPGDRVVNVAEAVVRLGFQEVYRIVAGICVGRLASPLQPGWGVDSARLWRHSAAAAVAAQLVAKDAGVDAPLAFTAGLLHDLGKIVLACVLERIYATLVEEAEREQFFLLEAERRRLGVQHAELGGRLLTRWNSPPALVAAVAFHHQPAGALGDERVAACAHVGNLIAHFAGLGGGEAAFSFRGRPEALRILGLGTERLPPYITQAMENLSMIELLLGFHS